MMKYRSIVLVGLSAFLISCGSESSPKEEGAINATIQISKGEQLINNYCYQCHGLNEDKIGPKLKGVFAYWDNDTVRISEFIRNARASIQTGDPRAVQVAKDWNNALMTPMPHLSDEDINAILEYIAE